MHRYSGFKNFYLLIPVTLAFVLSLLIINLFNIGLFLQHYYILKFVLIYALCIFFIYRIQHKYSFYLPSFYLFCFFSAVPIFGIPGYYYSYVKLYDDYLGVYLDMKHALDMWLQGTLFVMLGIFLTYIIKKAFLRFRKSKPKSNIYISWNWDRFYFILFLLAGISLIFTIAVVWKLGYIPIFKGNIEVERFSYYERVGDWTMKLSRLWLLVYLFAFIKLLKNIKTHKKFYISKNFSLIILLIFSLFFAGIYGERYYHFIMVVFSIIMINKVLGKVKTSHIVILFLVGILMANIVLFMRNIYHKESEATIFEKIMLTTFGEFRSFAYAVQEYPERDFLYGKAFIANIAPVFPKQVWRAFNIDKDELMRFNSASVMQKIFGHYSGIRIGIIGEGYINFGYVGILFIPFCTGILFGILENTFISLKNFDIKEIIVVFALSIIAFLPVAQSNVFSNIFFFNMYFIMVCIIFFNRKRIIKN